MLSRYIAPFHSTGLLAYASAYDSGNEYNHPRTLYVPAVVHTCNLDISSEKSMMAARTFGLLAGRGILGGQRMKVFLYFLNTIDARFR
jgi:hypothetical protein